MDSNKNKDDLLKDLKDENSFTRKETVKSLEKLGDKSVIPAFIDLLLHDPSSVVRHAAALAFQKQLADKSAAEALIKALEDSALYVRGAAASALGVIKEKRAVPHLCKALQDSEAHVRWSAIAPLANIGDVSAVAPLRKLIDNPSELPYVKNAARDALARLGKK